MGEIGPLGQISREHVRRPRRDPQSRGRRADPLGQGRADGAEADELPGPHPDLPPGHQILSRPAAAPRRVRLLPPQRAARRAARHHAGAPVHPGRRPHLLPRGPDRRGDAALLRPARLDLPAISASPIMRSSSRSGPRSGTAPTRSGTRPSRICARRSASPAATAAEYRLGGTARRGRLLRAQAGIPPDRRDRPDLAVRHAPARLCHARAARRLLYRRGRREARAR